MKRINPYLLSMVLLTVLVLLSTGCGGGKY
jgi:hypothetical protein